MRNLVIVESPAKASTIEKILGKDYKVVSSYGHIRDLSKKNMGVDLDNSFHPNYEVTVDKRKVLQSLIKESKKSDVVWLATDEDREGEAIAWHLYESINLHDKKVHRIVFNEITQTAIVKAVKNPRKINQNLVNAQQARRVLDRIVGFKLSPILWKKVRTGLSAGRVQSVAVRLIVDREKSISNFNSESSYNFSAQFLSSGSDLFPANMLETVITKNDAKLILNSMVESEFTVQSIENKPSQSRPSAPFTTSSLQQSASNKLGFSVTRTMAVAQKLYEAGHITYMRTDSTNLSKDAISSMAKYIIDVYGKNYSNPKNYSTNKKVAQEAHESIRPTNMFNLECGNDDAQKKLYKLIWQRAIGSQMHNAIFDKTLVSIVCNNKQKSIFHARGQVIKFDGYLRVQKDLFSSSNKDVILPPLDIGQKITLKSLIAQEKFSKSPSRFTEASLVKKLEDLGIGRPSTYAPTISTIQKREYVLKDDVKGTLKLHSHLKLEGGKIIEFQKEELLNSEKKKLIPTEIGKITNDFLVDNFSDILDYNFTAKVEDEFDGIAAGKKEWKVVLKTFYQQFDPKVTSVDQNSDKVTGIRSLGVDPNSKKPVYVRLGKYGPIVQIGDGGDSEKPKYAKLRKGQTIESLDLAEALDLFSLPRNLGLFNEKEIIVSEGRYGPYIRYNNKFISLKDNNPLKVDLETCIEIVKAHQNFEKNKIINSFEYKNDHVEILNGKYGPYIKYSKKNYKIPKNLDPLKLTIDDCLNLISKSSKK